MNQIEKIDELYQGANQGRWNCYDDSDSTGRQEIVTTGVTIARCYNGNPKGKEDAELIVALHEAWPKFKTLYETAKDELKRQGINRDLHAALSAFDTNQKHQCESKNE